MKDIMMKIITTEKTVRDSGDLIIILKSKHEIKNYVDSL